MDYSLLLGVHNCARAEQENKEQVDKGDEDDQDDDEDSESGSGLENKYSLGDRTWGWSGASGMATPPESPQGVVTRDASLQDEDSIIPELDIYAIPSSDVGCVHIGPSFDRVLSWLRCTLAVALPKDERIPRPYLMVRGAYLLPAASLFGWL
ncbi:unnamed protein product [Trichogramma brassicae]|uniref:PIPK domain-containing protein n=1 Tax=Trichogramma brassicae TaxID=86971 RepID=A0A6H5IAL6_9HYME|nr:unnamed protein product [Trichogramma brassicae]